MFDLNYFMLLEIVDLLMSHFFDAYMICIYTRK